MADRDSIPTLHDERTSRWSNRFWELISAACFANVSNWPVSNADAMWAESTFAETITFAFGASLKQWKKLEYYLSNPWIPMALVKNRIRADPRKISPIVADLLSVADKISVEQYVLLNTAVNRSVKEFIEELKCIAQVIIDGYEKDSKMNVVAQIAKVKKINQLILQASKDFNNLPEIKKENLDKIAKDGLCNLASLLESGLKISTSDEIQTELAARIEDFKIKMWSRRLIELWKSNKNILFNFVIPYFTSSGFNPDSQKTAKAIWENIRVTNKDLKNEILNYYSKQSKEVKQKLKFLGMDSSVE